LPEPDADDTLAAARIRSNEGILNRAASFTSTILAVFIAVAIVVVGRWYIYIAYSHDLFDEVGVGLNMMMPDPVRQIGCAKLKERFGHGSLPPAGCGANGAW
jgi:hypothetical protein